MASPFCSQDSFKTGSQNSQASSENDGFSTPKQYRHKRLGDLAVSQSQGTKSPALRIPASPMMQRLGYGTGVGVYLMERSPLKITGEIRSPWAIKKISKIRESMDIYSRRLEFEAEILRHLSHPNIIGYRAFGNPSVDSTFLAMEKASKSLADLIEEQEEEQIISQETSLFPAKHMEKVAIDIAKALDYLHNEKKLIHGDLKSPNVLVFGDFEIVKLCDFGVSRKIKEDGTLEGRYVGTQIWNPMEVILENRGLKKFPITAKADIYPYGLTLHEMVTLKPPHFNTVENTIVETDDDESSEKESAFDEQAFDLALEKQLGKRPALPDIDFHESYNLILGVFYCCTEEDPSKRPSAKEILSMLEPTQSQQSSLESKK